MKLSPEDKKAFEGWVLDRYRKNLTSALRIPLGHCILENMYVLPDPMINGMIQEWHYGKDPENNIVKHYELLVEDLKSKLEPKPVSVMFFAVYQGGSFLASQNESFSEEKTAHDLLEWVREAAKALSEKNKVQMICTNCKIIR